MKLDRDSSVPLYAQMKEALIREIDENKIRVGDKLPTLKEMADRYGVSLITVRRVVSDLATEGYLEAIRRSGTKVVEKQHENINIRGLTRNIGILFPLRESEETFIDPKKTPWTYEIFAGIQERLGKANYFSTIVPLGKDIKKAEKTIEKNKGNFAGFICFPDSIEGVFFSQLENSGKPYVMINRWNENIDSNYISANYYGGGIEAVNYLLKIGVTSYLILIETSPTHYSDFLKIRGFHETLLRKGIASTKIDIRNIRDLSVEEGRKTVKAYLKEGKIPEGIFATGDYLAMGAIRACHEAGLKVPEDVSVIGYTGIEVAKLFNSSLSVVQIPMYEMGRAAAKMLFRLIRNKARHVPGIELDTKLIIRESGEKLKEGVRLC